MENLIKFLHKNTLVRKRYNQKFKKTGVTFDEYCSYVYNGVSDNQNNHEISTVYGKPIERLGNYAFIHSVEEILIDEIYKFKCEKDDPYILDCGSNIGLSIIYFKHIYPKSSIIGFEPDKNIYKTCKKNIDAFGYKDVVLNNSALWIEDGELNFEPDDSLGGKISDKITSSKNLVKSERLKKYLNKKIDMLKIDIEGAEIEVMKDCKDNLHFVDKIFVEYHSNFSQPQKLDDLLNILSNAGFRYYIKPALDYMPHPFQDVYNEYNIAFDLQLNIFGYR